jgi:hypothetical protein
MLRATGPCMCAARGISGGRFRCPPSASRRCTPTGSRADCHRPPLRSNGCRSYSDALGHGGLYDEVKAVFRAAETLVAPADDVTLAVLRAASTHWLRHGYARTLVVDSAVPLPVAQQLLGTPGRRRRRCMRRPVWRRRIRLWRVILPRAPQIRVNWRSLT